LIQLSLPSDKDVNFATVLGHMFGPFGPNGVSDKETISYRHELDSLTQGMSHYGENSVSHYQYEGDLNANAFFTDLVPTPTATYPHQMTMKGFNLSTSRDVTIKANSGHVTGNHVRTNDTNSSTFITEAYEYLSATHFRKWVVNASKTNPSLKINVNMQNWELVSFTATKVTLRLTTYNATVPTEFARDWKIERPFAEIYTVVSTAIKGVVPSSAPIYVADIVRANTAGALSPSRLKMSIDSLIVSRLDQGSFNLEEVHFGDLASKAAKGVNRNSANMIAFLKDLRRPQDLIPKLRNLRSLKERSGNYLAVQYGVLPTVSDIQEIVGAFKKIEPYIDKNGFSTYNAVHSDERVSEDLSETLEQRIKVAIADEDVEFIRLMNNIHSSGFAPTLENMWDLVPYSFVLDWFIDIGGFLERIDSNLSLLRLDIRYATLSVKRNITMEVTPSPSFPVSGTISVVTYRRWTTSRCPLPPLSLSSEITVSDHWLEAGALILQRAK